MLGSILIATVGPLTLASFAVIHPTRWVAGTAAVTLAVIASVLWVGEIIRLYRLAPAETGHVQSLLTQAVDTAVEIAEGHTVVTQFAKSLGQIVTESLVALVEYDPAKADELLARAYDAAAVMTEHHPQQAEA